jgi:predicted TIM-barrel fold metal-dependent hydrolase
MVFGFAGQLFMRLSNRELGLAATRAYNEWIDEKWAAPYPSRIIKCQVTWLLDPEVAAGEIYRNAAREFKAVTFPDDPAALGLPPISDECWDPFLGACEETETAINLHVGSSSRSLPGGLMIHGLVAARLWMESAHVPLRFPNIKLVMAEGGCGWVPMWIDQLNWHLRHAQLPSEFYHWPRDAMPPDEVIRRNFFFTTYYDPSILALREQIGIDNIMFESDYPHEDSSWPNTQSFLAEQIGSLPQDEIEKLAWKNAACLYRLSVTPHSLGWEPSEPSGV